MSNGKVSHCSIYRGRGCIQQREVHDDYRLLEKDGQTEAKEEEEQKKGTLYIPLRLFGNGYRERRRAAPRRSRAFRQRGRRAGERAFSQLSEPPNL